VSENNNQDSQDSFSFVEAEKNILNFWEKEKAFQKSLELTKDKRPYIFYDGPPFATGLPHHGHLVASTIKDIIPRYFTMKGFYIERRFGWDCHGLPVEYEIDKKMGMSAQDTIKKIGVRAYNDECRSIVQRFSKEWETTIKRIGRWVDFENDYKTMDPEFMESVWWVVKQLWEKDLIYEGTKVVPYSVALGTVLSNHEASSNYQDVQDPAITALFELEEPLEGDEKTYLAAWTTTPWTLPSNLGICLGKDIDYVKVLDEDKNITMVIAKERLQAVAGKKKKLKVLDEFKGDILKGKKYKPLFPYFESFKAEGAFQVLNDDFVTTDSGTGVVHMAPDFGEDDNRIMKEAGLYCNACPVDEMGKFTEEVTDYKNTLVKSADKQIIKDLKNRGVLYDQGVIVHAYPHCPRSNTPLIYRSIPSWYVKVETIKDKIIAANKQIKWVPGHIKEGRFGKWLEGARDWAISRNRVFGTPLPIWVNDKTDKKICIGSIEELENYTKTKVTDLHRENVDDLSFELPGEEGTYRRITEVLDCWFESGSMPYAQIHYPFQNKDVFEQGFPAEFIAEGLDQTRGWFYTLTVLAAALYEKPAFKNVIVNGLVMAEDGKKMSKSLKNYTAPDELMDKYGADALRLYLINSGLVKGEEQRFADTGVKDMVRRALLPWFNSFKFFQTYASIDQWKADEHLEFGKNITDKWILSNLQTLKKNISKEMEEYRLYNVVPALFTFIEDLTNWYIRLNRSRFWGEGLSQDKKEAYSTLYTAIKELSTAMAPFSPFLSDYIYQELKKFGQLEQVSVHHCSYPVPNEEFIDSHLEDAVGRMQQIILLGRQKRNKTSIKVKTPLPKLTIIHKNKELLKEISKLEGYIKSELNVKEVVYSEDEDKFIKLYAKPNSPVLGKRFGKEFGKFRQAISKMTPADLLSLEENGQIEILGEKLSPSDVLIFREAKEGSEALSNRFISIELDCNLTDELLAEGLAREVVNRIQKSRKELGFNVSDRIKITYNGSDRISHIIQVHREYISKETLAISLEQGPLSQLNQLEYNIDSMEISLSIDKV